jgi:hypothetical protein
MSVIFTFFTDPQNIFGLASFTFFIMATVNAILHLLILLPQFSRIEKDMIEYVPIFMKDTNIPVMQKNHLGEIIASILDIAMLLNCHSRRMLYVTLCYIGIFLICNLYFNKLSLGMNMDIVIIYLQLAIIPIMLLNEILLAIKTYNVARYCFNACEKWFYYAKEIKKIFDKGTVWLNSPEGIAELLILDAKILKETEKYHIK